eukprot:TRINITY_DN9647_c0_g1_i5.p1 TRINITY_DN9647_c0_g1~~TRINITY_DN9647_c0_g1_i5.p1  ORF type:complete len:447 (-),score=91.82 TRINITY_DN9647_c0_g1_i5:832-2172(-)
MLLLIKSINEKKRDSSDAKLAEDAKESISTVVEDTSTKQHKEIEANSEIKNESTNKNAETQEHSKVEIKEAVENSVREYPEPSKSKAEAENRIDSAESSGGASKMEATEANKVEAVDESKEEATREISDAKTVNIEPMSLLPADDANPPAQNEEVLVKEEVKDYDLLNRKDLKSHAEFSNEEHLENNSHLLNKKNSIDKDPESLKKDAETPQLLTEKNAEQKTDEIVGNGNIALEQDNIASEHLNEADDKNNKEEAIIKENELVKSPVQAEEEKFPESETAVLEKEQVDIKEEQKLNKLPELEDNSSSLKVIGKEETGDTKSMEKTLEVNEQKGNIAVEKIIKPAVDNPNNEDHPKSNQIGDNNELASEKVQADETAAPISDSNIVAEASNDASVEPIFTTNQANTQEQPPQDYKDTLNEQLAALEEDATVKRDNCKDNSEGTLGN